MKSTDESFFALAKKSASLASANVGYQSVLAGATTTRKALLRPYIHGYKNR